MNGDDRDRDEITRLEEDARSYRSLLEHVPVVVYICHDDELAITEYVSPNAHDLLGAPPEAFTSAAGAWFRTIHEADRPAVTEAWAAAREAGGPFQAEYRMFRADGTSIWVRDRATRSTAPDGTRLWHGAILDVTQEHVAAAEVAVSERRYRALVDELPVTVYVDSDEAVPRSIFISPNVQEILGISSDDERLWLDSWVKLIHPDDHERVLAALDVSFRDGAPFDLEYRFVRPDGTVVWVHDHSVRVRSGEGDSSYWQGVLLDVTSQVQAEQAAIASEHRFRNLVERLPVVVYAVEDALEPRTLYLSPNIGALIGRSETDAVSADELTFPDFVDADDRGRAWEAWTHALATRSRFDTEYRIRRSDGETVWIHDSCVLVEDEEGQQYWQGVMIDITPEKRATEEQRESETRFRTLVEQLPGVVYIVTDEILSRTVYASPTLTDLLGFETDKGLGLGEGWLDLIHPADRGPFLAVVTDTVDHHNVFEGEYRIVRPDGSHLWLRDHATLIRDESGDRRFWQGIMLDVTEEREAALDLATSEARHRALVENIPAVVYEMGLDDDRRTIYVSKRVEELLGYTREEWLEQPDIWTELLHPDDRENELAAHDVHSESGEPWSREYRLIAADGHVVWVHDQATLIRDADGAPLTWHGVMLDITAQKRAEDRLRAVNEDLEMRVMTRTAELAEANELMELEIGERRRVERQLRTAEERFRQLVEGSPVVVYAFPTRAAARPHELRYVSPQIERLLGYTADEWLEDRDRWRSRVHPHDRERIAAASRHSETTGAPFEQELRYLAKDGNVVWVLERAWLAERDEAGRPLLFQGVMVDVTAQKEAEQRARESEARYSQLTNAGPVITYVLELLAEDPPRVGERFVSAQIAEIFPQGDTALSPEEWLTVIHPDDRARLADAVARRWRTGERWDVDYRVLAKDGRVAWLNDRGLCVERHPDGAPRVLSGVLIDITDRMTAAEEQRRELETLQHAVTALPVLLWGESVDRHGRVRSTFFSPNVVDLLGWTAQELIAVPAPLQHVIHPDDRQAVIATMRAGRSGAGTWRAEHRVVRKDGQVRWVRSWGRRTTPAGVEPAEWHGVMIDITDEREPETAETARADASD